MNVRQNNKLVRTKHDQIIRANKSCVFHHCWVNENMMNVHLSKKILFAYPLKVSEMNGKFGQLKDFATWFWNTFFLFTQIHMTWKYLPLNPGFHPGRKEAQSKHSSLTLFFQTATQSFERCC